MFKTYFVKRSTLLILTFFLIALSSGCSSRPYLTKENTFNIINTTANGLTTETPLILPWNTNSAVLNKLLIEASFVLSDLKSIQLSQLGVEQESQLTVNQESQLNVDQESQLTVNQDNVFLETSFPESKHFNLVIDNVKTELDIQSIQVGVKGTSLGKVIINRTLMFQGIPNPNLEPAYDDFLKLINKSSESDKNQSILRNNTVKIFKKN